MKAFTAPEAALGTIDAEAAAAMIAAASDLALILDASGVIRDVSVADEDLLNDLAGHGNWLGKPWAGMVSDDSRSKAEAMIAAASSRQEPRWRHINHPAAGGASVPILCAAVSAGTPGRIVVFGRDLRAVSSLQRRLVDAQQSMERDYIRIRHVETRYRLLFQVASDAVLIVDEPAGTIVDSNPTARRLLAAAADPGGRWTAAAAFTAETAAGVDRLLTSVRASGRADDVHARLRDGDREVVVSAAMFREETGLACLVRIAGSAGQTGGAALPKLKAKLLKLIEGAPDGFVVTEAGGRILTVNATFLELVQLPAEALAHNEPLGRWLGRSGVDLDILIANLRQHGSVRLFTSQLRGELGDVTDVEISAVTVMNGGQPCFGFAIRDVGRRLQRGPAAGRAPASERVLPRSLDQLTELIGRVALKDLVREATDAIERLCIEAALNLAGDNRASAAEMLGLSRQSLYVKLRRYGLGDLEPAGAD